MVPHLITALTGPINELEQRMLESLPAIERWFRLEWMEHTPPFYTSVDLRNAGFKLAPVDTNLFPGGFNNLTTEMLPLAVQAAMAAIEKICPEAKNLLLIPEKHTRNSFYLMNVARLMEIFHQAGLNVRLGTLDETITAPTPVPLPDGSSLTVEPLVRTRNRLGLKDFDPCTILLNNDLSAGIPKILEGLHEAAQTSGGTSDDTFGGFPVPVAGKTGTAERDGQNEQSWYAVLSPYPNPEIITVVTMEEGGFGDESAAPAAHEILEAYYHEHPTKEMREAHEAATESAEEVPAEEEEGTG